MAPIPEESANGVNIIALSTVLSFVGAFLIVVGIFFMLKKFGYIRSAKERGDIRNLRCRQSRRRTRREMENERIAVRDGIAPGMETLPEEDSYHIVPLPSQPIPPQDLPRALVRDRNRGYNSDGSGSSEATLHEPLSCLPSESHRRRIHASTEPVPLGSTFCPGYISYSSEQPAASVQIRSPRESSSWGSSPTLDEEENEEEVSGASSYANVVSEIRSQIQPFDEQPEDVPSDHFFGSTVVEVGEEEVRLQYWEHLTPRFNEAFEAVDPSRGSPLVMPPICYSPVGNPYGGRAPPATPQLTPQDSNNNYELRPIAPEDIDALPRPLVTPRSLGRVSLLLNPRREPVLPYYNYEEDELWAAAYAHDRNDARVGRSSAETEALGSSVAPLVHRALARVRRVLQS